MLVGIVRFNTFTKQYWVETMATKEPHKKVSNQPGAMQVSGTGMGLKTPESSTLQKSEPLPTIDENSAVDQMMTINRRLVAQIETLRLKVDVDTRHHEQAKAGLVRTTDSKVKARELELSNLKAELKHKEDKLSVLTKQNEKKSSEIRNMQEHIDDLKDDVAVSQNYADQIQSQLEQLRLERSSLQTGSAYKKKDEEIQKLQHEVDTLRKHLNTLEKELIRAKEKIAKQGGQLRLTEMERGSMQIKFREELAKVSFTMRHEIERMRDVMKQQWEEMRELREQNEYMRSDIKEIRELLSEQVQAENNQERIYGHPQSPFNLHPLTPSLPTISNSKDNRRILHGKKK